MLKSQIPQDDPNNSSFHLVIDFQLIKNIAKEISADAGNKLTLYLILLEVTLFKPYYLLGNNSDEQFKNLKISDEDKLTNKLKFFARTLDIDSAIVIRFQSNYKQAIEGIRGGFNPWLIGAIGAVVLAVLAAFFTPAMAALLAPILAPGLSGAAAVSAVLAALGGGAIAAGGFAVIIVHNYSFKIVKAQKRCIRLCRDAPYKTTN